MVPMLPFIFFWNTEYSVWIESWMNIIIHTIILYPLMYTKLQKTNQIQFGIVWNDLGEGLTIATLRFGLRPCATRHRPCSSLSPSYRSGFSLAQLQTLSIKVYKLAPFHCTPALPSHGFFFRITDFLIWSTKDRII